MDEVQAHEQDDTVRERVLYPEHVQRTESAARPSTTLWPPPSTAINSTTTS